MYTTIVETRGSCRTQRPEPILLPDFSRDLKTPFVLLTSFIWGYQRLWSLGSPQQVEHHNSLNLDSHLHDIKWVRYMLRLRAPLLFDMGRSSLSSIPLS